MMFLSNTESSLVMDLPKVTLPAEDPGGVCLGSSFLHSSLHMSLLLINTAVFLKYTLV